MPASRPRVPSSRRRASGLFLVLPAGQNIYLCLCHGNRLALRLNCKAVLLEIASGQVGTNAGDNLAYRADGGGRITHSQIAVHSEAGPILIGEFQFLPLKF
jgi:hypothetical protein